MLAATIVAGLMLAVSGGTATSPAAASGAPAGCRSGTPLANVYHPYRLEVVEGCLTVTGTVTSVRREDDGDIHVNLSLPGSESDLLNAGNVSDQHGDLVTEIVPADQPGCTPGKPPPLPPTAYTTAGYVYGTCTGADLKTPAVGEKVTVVGPYVLDRDHGWMEVHPVWAIVLAGGGATAGVSGADSLGLPQWSAVNLSAVSQLTRAAVSYEQHAKTQTKCRTLARSVNRAKKSSPPPRARSTWKKALKNLQSASSSCRAGGGSPPLGKTNVAVGVRIGLGALAHFARYLVRHGVRFGRTMLVLMTLPLVAKAHPGSRTTKPTTTSKLASPTLPATTAPPPPTTMAPSLPTTTKPPSPPPTAAPPPQAPGPWCSASASPASDGFAGDDDVYVHSNRPYAEATASDSTDTYSYETNSTGSAIIYLWTQYAGERITVTVGGAHCSTVAQ